MPDIENPFPQPAMLAIDERSSLREWLDFQRNTLVWKIEGVDEDAFQESIVSSGTSLCWLIKHCTHAEIHWFQQVFLGLEPEWPYPDPDVGYTLYEDQTIESIVATYQRVCELHRRIEAEATSLDQVSLNTHDDEHATLRWIMQHMIEETARHDGHADIAREVADGTTGY